MQVPDAIVSGVVTATGSVVNLPNIPCRWVILQAKTGNTAAITVGGPDITIGVGGMVLTAGTIAPQFLIDNLNKLSMIGNDDDVLHYLVFR